MKLSPRSDVDPASGGRAAFLISHFSFLILGIVLVTIAPGCAHRQAAAPIATATTPKPAKPGWTEKGVASWYGHPYHGRRTASGEIYDMHRMTAAHRTLPFGTMVRITRRDSHASVKVRINDRGPFVEDRIIDLSYAAAKKIGLDTDGIASVDLVVIGRTDPADSPPVRGGDSDGGGCFWIQVGAFDDLGNARRLEADLERRGERAVVMDGPNGMFRVRVGPFAKAREAEKVLERVRKHWPDAQPVPCG